MIAELDEEKIIESFRDFLSRNTSVLRHSNNTYIDYSGLNSYSLLPNQALYVFDFKNLVVPFQRNICSLLGYSENEFTYNLITSYIHPDEITQYLMITKYFIQFIQTYKPDPYKVMFSLSYRVKKKDSTFIKILRHTVNFQNDEDRNMVCNMSVLTDVTDIIRDNFITYSIKGEGKEVELAKQYFINFYKNQFFTKREQQLLFLLSQGKNSQEISKALCLSKHTIDTHRRNMIHKASCKNTLELIDFSRHNGII
jgi:DNA-binding CsgD family transcriptional regulator